MRIGPATAVLAFAVGCFAPPQGWAAKESSGKGPPPPAEEVGGPIVEIAATPIREPAPQLRACGTPAPSHGDLEACSEALRRYREDRGAAAGGGVIRVAAHVITPRGEGLVSDDQIAQQVAELNRAYAGSGFRFELTRVDRTVHPQWFRMGIGSRKEAEAKRALVVDPAHWLNLYVCAPAQGLGWASLPFSAPEEHWIHGVVLHHETLPGGRLAGYNLGRTAAHEVGHYLGLLHASHGRGLTPVGVADGMPAKEFTAGQVEHIQSMVAVYRPSLFGASLVDAARAGEIRPEASLPGDAPRTLEFRGAVPNPFRLETAIRFNVPRADRVTLKIYNVAGQLVRTVMDAHLPPGEHSAMFRAAGLPSGMYFASLRVGAVQMNRSLVLIQ